MKNNKKASALIVAVMVSIILLLIASGLYVVVRYNISSTSDILRRSKLQYAAQSGLNYGVVWLKHIPYSQFNGVSPQSLTKDITVDGKTVRVTASCNGTTGEWTILSQTTGTGEKCKITLNNIFGDTPLRYSSFSSDGTIMTGWYGRDQIWIGDVYFNSNIKLQFLKNGNPATAAFYGAVDCTNDFASLMSNKSDKDLSGSVYGVYSKGINLRADGNYNDMTASQIKSVLDNTFQVYNSGVAKQPVNLISDDWVKLSEVKTTTKNYTGSTNITFGNSETFSIGATNYPAGTYYAKINQGSTTTYIPQSDVSIIAVDGTVNVKGVLNNDITVVTRSQNINITSDLYAVGYADYISKTNANFANYSNTATSHPANTIQDVTTGNCNIGLIAGAASITDNGSNGLFSGPTNARVFTPTGAGAKIVIAKGSGTDANDNASNGVILITAGLFAPNGELIAEKNGEGWSNGLNAVIYGSFLGYGEGTTAQSSGSSYIGISPYYIGSEFFKRGRRPPGFKGSTELNPLTNNIMNKLGATNWSMEWLCN